MVQRVAAKDKEWERVTISANFPFFEQEKNLTTKHSKENRLNLEEDLLN